MNIDNIYGADGAEYYNDAFKTFIGNVLERANIGFKRVAIDYAVPDNVMITVDNNEKYIIIMLESTPIAKYLLYKVLYGMIAKVSAGEVETHWGDNKN